jgi:hypothetical protein
MGAVVSSGGAVKRWRRLPGEQRRGQLGLSPCCLLDLALYAVKMGRDDGPMACAPISLPTVSLLARCAMLGLKKMNVDSFPNSYGRLDNYLFYFIYLSALIRKDSVSLL